LPEEALVAQGQRKKYVLRTFMAVIDCCDPGNGITNLGE
jgi:hypothetical protein